MNTTEAACSHKSSAREIILAMEGAISFVPLVFLVSSRIIPGFRKSFGTTLARGYGDHL